MKKLISAISVALLFSFLPALSNSWAADTTTLLQDGYPPGAAPNRDCGNAAGDKAMLGDKELTCTPIPDLGPGVNEWQFSDGTKVARSGGPHTPLTNSTNDEAFTEPAAPGLQNYQGLYHNDLVGLTRFTSALLDMQPSDQSPSTVTSCSSATDSKCPTTGVFHYYAVLPGCDGANPTNCFSHFTATKPDGTVVQGVVQGIFNHDNPQDFTGDAATGLPTGTEPTLVTFPGISHSGGDTFLVKPEMTGSKKPGDSQWTTSSFKVSLYAVKMVNGIFGFSQLSTDPVNYQNGINEAGGKVIGANPAEGCAAASTTQCAEIYPLPLDLSFGISVKFSKNLTGWLHGRITKPTITLQNETNGGATLTINAKAIKTPDNAVWATNDKLPSALTSFYGDDHSGNIVNGPGNLSAPFSQIAIMRDGNMYHTANTLQEYVYWLPLLGEKAQALPTMWAVETMSNGDPNSPVAKCINQTNSLAGLVTTNAAEYVDGPPVFANNTLDYKVAATHFEKDGSTPFQGTYDLLMSSKVARCIYGFTNAPIKATISVTNDTGGASVASTVINEANGWLTLGAYGFTYSNPTIKVKLTQDAPVVAAPAPAVSPAPATTAATVAKKITITCVKGKTSKTVSGVKPICPSGFKKK